MGKKRSHKKSIAQEAGLKKEFNKTEVQTSNLGIEDMQPANETVCRLDYEKMKNHLNNLLAQKNADMQTVASQYAEVKMELLTLQEQCEQMQVTFANDLVVAVKNYQDIVDKKKTLEKKENQNEKENIELKQELGNVRKENNNLKQRIKKLEVNVRTVEELNSHLKNENLQLKSESENNEKTSKVIGQKLSEVELELENVVLKNNEMEHHIDFLQEDNFKLKENNIVLLKSLENSIVEKENLENVVTRLHKNLQSQQEENLKNKASLVSEHAINSALLSTDLENYQRQITKANREKQDDKYWINLIKEKVNRVKYCAELKINKRFKFQKRLNASYVAVEIHCIVNILKKLLKDGVANQQPNREKEVDVEDSSTSRDGCFNDIICSFK